MALGRIEDKIEGSFLVQQNQSEPSDHEVTLQFGPLSATMRQLFGMGYTIICQGRRVSQYSPKQHRFYLRGPSGVYRLGSISQHHLDTAKSFLPFIKKFQPMPVTANGRLSDPLEILQAKYPKPMKAPPSMGNQTLAEFIRSM